MRRSVHNPILTRENIPDVSRRVSDVTSVFNPGAVKLDDRIVLLLRVQTRGRETVLMIAESRDGERFDVRPDLIEIDGANTLEPRPLHVYDPRLTRIDDELYAVLSADSERGCHLLVAAMTPELKMRLVSHTTEREARNGVLFPEKIGGRYCRLERPNTTRHATGSDSGDKIWLATSEDLVEWKSEGPVMAGRPHFWDELIGSGPPPVKTERGWLHVYHGVARHVSGVIYQAGVCLLDLKDPTKVVARGRNNILEPREPYELIGQVPNVVFPTGLIVEDAGRARLYYGAADTSIGVAETTIDDLLAACDVE